VKIRATLGPIRGVVHAAAVYSDADTPGFASKALDRMRQVWEPKAAGLESLHAVFKTDPLDFFVSLTSLTGLIPHLARGASDYAMANSFVEVFTAYQNQQVGDTRYKTVSWSDWNETGAITRIDDAKAAAIKDTFDRLGMRTFSNLEGCALFERAMACRDESRVVIGYLDQRRFKQVGSQLLYARPDRRELEPPTASCDDQIRKHIERWKAERRSGSVISIAQITSVISLDEIKRLDPSLIHDIHDLLFGSAVPKETNEPADTDYERIIAGAVKEVLKLKNLDSGQPFQNYGLDSISATVLAARLEKKLKREMPPKWLIEFPTVETLSRHLIAQDGTLSQRAR
jgi:acyl carrier protein